MLEIFTKNGKVKCPIRLHEYYGYSIYGCISDRGYHKLRYSDIVNNFYIRKEDRYWFYMKKDF